MRTRTGRRRLTYLELALVTIVLAILATITCPMLLQAESTATGAADREKKRMEICSSNIRQIALAINMYAQDNGSQYPGIDDTSWVSKVSPYIADAPAVFTCPSDASLDDNCVSYALSGLLIRQDGTGIKESQILSPSEVGALCDASPSEQYPLGRVIGGGGMQPIEVAGAVITPRHSKGAVVGFCDGHSKYYQGIINQKDAANGAVRAMYHAAPLGLVDNPVAMLDKHSKIPELTGTVTVGGEYATYPLLMAAAKVYGSYYTRGFRGQYDTLGRPGANWVWGAAGTDPEKVAPQAIAYDAVCIIVAKGSKIPSLPALVNQTYALPIPAIKKLFETGYRRDAVQVYKMEDWCSTNAYVKKVIGNTNWGTDSIVVAKDAEMIEKVANDPYGIGYCSSAFADPDRVVVLAPIINGNTCIWPQASEKNRWVMPAFAESTWPWKRHLDVACSGDQLGTGIAAALRRGGLKSGLEQSPFFTWGYWPGTY